MSTAPHTGYHIPCITVDDVRLKLAGEVYLQEAEEYYDPEYQLVHQLVESRIKYNKNHNLDLRTRIKILEYAIEAYYAHAEI